MSSEEVGRSRATKPPFLKLPLEIRQQIYRMLLPSQDVLVRSRQWSNLVESSNEYLESTKVNRQISDEAREILYSRTASSIVVSDKTTKFLGFRKLFARQALLLDPVPKMLPVDYMKHWQLGLLFNDYASVYTGAANIEDALGAVSIELIKIPDLQTLKISLRCLCDERGKASKNTLEAARQCILPTLEPLRLLRANLDVLFITTRGRWPWEDAVEAYYAANPAPSDNSMEAWLKWRVGEPEWWHPTENERVNYAVKSAANKQCQEIACLDFAESFNGVKAIIEGVAPPDGISSRRKTWLQLRDYAATMLPQYDSFVHLYALDPTSRAILTASDLDFDQVVGTAYQTLRARLKYLRSSGRSEQFFKYQEEGLPESMWEQRFQNANEDVYNDTVAKDYLKMQESSWAMEDIAYVPWQTRRAHAIAEFKETAKTDGFEEDTVDSALDETDSEVEDQWPSKDWWLQKTETYTETVEHNEVTAGSEIKDDTSLAKAMSELSIPGAYNEEGEGGYCNIL